MTRDLTQALRRLWKNPWFLAAVIAILALGIGANTAVFSIADAVLLRPPPYQAAARLVSIEQNTPKWEMSVISADDYLSWGARRDLFEKTVAYRRDIVTLTNAGDPDQVFVVRTSPQMFSLLGVPARLGRTLLDSDDAAEWREFRGNQRPALEAQVRWRSANPRAHYYRSPAKRSPSWE